MAKQISCEDAGMDCAFMIRSESEDELVGMVQDHAEHQHHVEMSENDVRELMKAA